MRNLAKQEKIYKYAEYLGKEPILDKDGNKTGDTRAQFSTFQYLVGSEVDKNTLVYLPFGSIEDYEIVITTFGMNTVNEKCVFWVNATDTSTYNYRVRKIAKSENVTLIALQKV